MQKKNYKTAGKQALIDFLARNPDRQFTTEELCFAVNGDRESGKSSVYRHLTDITQEITEIVSGSEAL